MIGPGARDAGPWSAPGRTTLELHTGGWRTRRPAYVEAMAPCRAACPAHGPIPRWIERARRGDWAGAWTLIREENPFPAVLGRVCGHPCEGACNRGAHDAAVAVNALERFVGDWGLSHGRVVPPAGRRGARVAIVGAGPAGLAAAYHLARLAYPVTVFDAEDAPGGLLRYGIPEYRLPRGVLERELDLVFGLGIEIVTGARLGAGVPWSELTDFAAVLLATGAARSLGLGVPGEDADGVRDGLAFLRAAGRGRRGAPGGRLVVVGGGSTAMDVARTARRFGVPAVTVVALEAREAMPADRDEVRQALAEGIEIVNGAGVRRFAVARGGALTGVEIAPATLVRGEDGAVRPAFGDGAPRVLAADTALLALGQAADLDALPPGARHDGAIVTVDADGTVVGTRRDGPRLPPLFAGGDVASRRRTVVDAVAAGGRAARAMHSRLSGEAVPAPWEPAWASARPDRVIPAGAIARHRFPAGARAERLERRPGERVASFVEVQRGLAAVAALRESARCFTCGHCTACDTCFDVCPDMAIRRDNGGYAVVADHCKGCGLCAAECPRGALAMAAEP